MIYHYHYDTAGYFPSQQLFPITKLRRKMEEGYSFGQLQRAGKYTCTDHW